MRWLGPAGQGPRLLPPRLRGEWSFARPDVLLALGRRGSRHCLPGSSHRRILLSPSGGRVALLGSRLWDPWEAPVTPRVLLLRLVRLLRLSLMSPAGTVRLEVSGWSLSARARSRPCWGRSAGSGFGNLRVLVGLPLARRYHNDRRWIIFSQRPELAVEQTVLGWKIGC